MERKAARGDASGLSRRDVFRVAGGLAAGLAWYAAATPAAQAQTYPSVTVAVTEQRTSRVVHLNRDAWTEAAHTRAWTGRTDYWANPTDVKLRGTSAFGTVGLVAASGGNVGLYDVTAETEQSTDDLLWSAQPGGNPHGVERIPGSACVVVASSQEGGFLTLYAPTDAQRPETLGRVQLVPFAGARGVLWDPARDVLWAIGTSYLRSYTVSGRNRSARLARANKTLRFSGVGHDVQPDYTNRRTLLIVTTYGGYQVDVATMKARRLIAERGMKSLCRHTSGEYVWTVSDNVAPRTWTTDTVRFTSGTRTRAGDQIYRARISTTRFN